MSDDLLMTAWGLLANVSDGDWSKQTPEWQEPVYVKRTPPAAPEGNEG